MKPALLTSNKVITAEELPGGGRGIPAPRHDTLRRQHATVSTCKSPSTHPHPRLAATCLPRFVGIVFLCAGILKGYDLLTGTSSLSGILGLALLPYLLIEVELTLGLTLLFNIRPHLSRPVTLVLLAFFLCWNVTRDQRCSGKCACLGQIEVHPWIMASMDVVLFAIIWQWRPSKELKLMTSPLLDLLRTCLFLASLGILGPTFLSTWMPTGISYPQPVSARSH